MNIAALEPDQRAAELRHADAADQYYDRMQSIPVDDVIEAIPEVDLREYGTWLMEAIGKGLDGNDKALADLLVRARREYEDWLRELA